LVFLHLEDYEKRIIIGLDVSGVKAITIQAKRKLIRYHETEINEKIKNPN